MQIEGNSFFSRRKEERESEYTSAPWEDAGISSGNINFIRPDDNNLTKAYVYPPGEGMLACTSKLQFQYQVSGLKRNPATGWKVLTESPFVNIKRFDR